MHIEIMDKGITNGSAVISRDGLYYKIHAQMPQQEGIVRLWAHEQGRSILLGVMTPSTDGLRLDKRISASAFAFSEQTRITTQERLLAAFEGTVLGINTCGYLEEANGKRTLLIDFAQTPFSMMELVCFFRIEKRTEGIFWAIDLTKDNVPVLMQESTDFD